MVGDDVILVGKADDDVKIIREVNVDYITWDVSGLASIKIGKGGEDVGTAAGIPADRGA